MAGMVVTPTVGRPGSITKVVFEWLSDDAAGTASGPTLVAVDGRIVGFTTIPDAVAAPTASYDITVTDSDGHDVLLGAGANRSATATEHVTEGSLGMVAGSVLTLNVANAGNAKEGVVILYLR